MNKKESAMNDESAWPINCETLEQYDANRCNSHDDDHFEMKQLFLIISSSELEENPKSNAALACMAWCIQSCIPDTTRWREEY